MKKHLYKCPVRWSDMDVYGVVNNVSVLRLLEEARVDFIWGLSGEGEDAFFQNGSVVVDHTIKYIKPIVHTHEPIDIFMWVSNVGAATVTINYEIKDGDKTCSIAATTMAPYCYKKSRPRSLTPQEEDFFLSYLSLDESLQ